MINRILNSVLLLLILPTLSFCQISKWSIGIIGSPNFYTIKSPTGFNHEYTTEPSYSGGVDLTFHFTQHSEIKTGIIYTTLGYKVEYNYFHNNIGDPNVPTGGEIKATYLDIPLFYDFNFIAKEKLIAFASAGVVASPLISSNDRTLFEDCTIKSSGFLNSFLLSVQFGAGIQYNFTNKIGIKLIPQYRLYLKGIDRIMEQNPTAFIGTLGIVFNLGAK